jgi:hypothetical protein
MYPPQTRQIPRAINKAPFQNARNARRKRDDQQSKHPEFWAYAA